MAKTLSFRFKDTPEDQARAKEIVELLRDSAIPDLSWVCERCGTVVPCEDGAPLPNGWIMGHTPQGPGPICDRCKRSE